ncbi:MAG: hypothetical protein D6717_05005 [Gammaproteobacteria bacterium]|nr:MAG: hypothetical protein D6717_05005 [Gammaproteobacteria bacterium]
MIRRLLAVPALLLLSACSSVGRVPAATETASPPLHDAARGATLQIARPFEPGGKNVAFAEGRPLGWFSVTAWKVKCTLHFAERQDGPVNGGLYRVERTRYASMPSGDEEIQMTTLWLKTLKGPRIETISCQHAGSLGEPDLPGPITVQEFRHAFGKYLLMERPR